jgi:sarcosine oxidase subunit beta
VSELPSKCDVVVVGAGIVGAGAALRLARRGVDVVLVDKGEVAFEQSSRNWGWVRQNGRNLREIPAAVASRRLWSELERDVGGDVGWCSQGNLHLAYDDGEMRLFEAWREAAARSGLETEMVSARDIDAMAPGLQDRFVGGIFSPLDGQADPHRAAQLLAEAAVAAGAVLQTGCAVTRLDVSGGRVRAVECEQGTIAAETVVVAAGAWSSRLLWPVGLALPQRKASLTVCATQPVAALGRTVVWAKGLALRQDHAGSFVLAGPGGQVPVDLEFLRFRDEFRGAALDTSRREEVTPRLGSELPRDLAALLGGAAGCRGLWPQVRAEEPEPDTAAAQSTLARFRQALPAYACARLERVWAGFVDYTPDAIPVIDRPPAVEGLVVATGFSGHGFALGPIGGLLAAQLALQEPTEVDVRPFRLARFAEGDTAERELHF